MTKDNINTCSAPGNKPCALDHGYTFDLTQDDKAMLERLWDFIPDKVFDAHLLQNFPFCDKIIIYNQTVLADFFAK